MWKQTCLLAGVQLRNLWGWNQIVYGKDVKKKRRLILMMVSFIIIGVMFAFYSAISSYGMIVIGVGRLVPAALFSIISIIILFFCKKYYNYFNKLYIRRKILCVKRRTIRKRSLVLWQDCY